MLHDDDGCFDDWDPICDECGRGDQRSRMGGEYTCDSCKEEAKKSACAWCGEKYLTETMVGQHCVECDEFLSLERADAQAQQGNQNE